MASLTSSPGALRLTVVSVLARLPMAMLSIGLLVHAEHLTGSLAAAGVVAGAYAVALGVSGPLLGRLVDRRGQTAVLVTCAAVAGAALAATAALPAGTPLLALVALAVVVGMSAPPVGACMRALLPAVVADRAALRAAYAAESAAIELTWISGPPLVLAVAAAWSTGAALAVAGVVLVAGTAVFAAEPASRAWRPAPMPPQSRSRGSLRAPAMRTLVIVLLALGVVFGRSRSPSWGPRTRSAARPPLGRCSASGAPARWRAASSRPAWAAARAQAPASRSSSPRWRPATSRSPRPPAARSRSPSS